MPAARRTGDEEGRIVHGGELPEDEGSLDDVVVDKPYQKQPDELWTSYLIRRLGYEGIEVSEFECNDCNNLNSTTKLNEGVSLVLDRNVGVDPFIFKKDNKYFMTPGGRKALRKDASKNDFVRNLLYYEAITLNYNDTIEFICFIFDSEDLESLDLDGRTSPEDLEYSPDWFNRKYSNESMELKAMEVVDDIVRYVKEQLGNQNDNT